MKPRGGTELLISNLYKYLGTDWQEIVNLVPSFCDPKVLNPKKINIIWQHLSYDQRNVAMMSNPNFIDKVDGFVYVSNWQLDQFSTRFPIQAARNYVIKNAIDSIEYQKKPDGKIRLIYTSMPNRGLSILLDVFDQISSNDIELIVYSSNIIYGKTYTDQSVLQLLHRCELHPNIIYNGYGTNKAVRRALQYSHILSYPSIFEETSCLSAIEAGAAGCAIVTTNLGALPETCGDYASYVDFTEDKTELVNLYATELLKVIDNYKNKRYNTEAISNWFNNEYSWANRAIQWEEFFKIYAKHKL